MRKPGKLKRGNGPHMINSLQGTEVCLFIVCFSGKTLVSVKHNLPIAALITAERTLEMPQGTCPAHDWHSASNSYLSLLVFRSKNLETKTKTGYLIN